MSRAPHSKPTTPGPGRYRRLPHAVAVLAAAFTLPLIFVGGSVTSYGVGLAVPDWPTTFGMNMFLYDFWNAPFGVRVEHAHRLYGAAVGLATVALTGSLLACDGRRSVKALGVVALAAVVAQGVLGGTRVTQVSTLLAAFHGCLGQAFFGLTVGLAVVTGRTWLGAGPARPDAGRLRPRAAALVALVFAQVAVGAWFRHYRTAPALWAHGLLALGVLGHGLALAVSAGRRGAAPPELRASARALGAAVVVQVALGALALGLMLPLGGNPRPPTLWQAMTRTAHQTNGALLLGAAVVLALRAYRHLAPSPDAAPEPAPRAVEAVA